MSAPKRIQRKRTKGWRMPEGAVYVGRASRWGNPFRWESSSTIAAIERTPVTRDCIQCGKPTEVGFSYDIDLPTVPACDSACMYRWLFIQINRQGKATRREP